MSIISRIKLYFFIIIIFTIISFVLSIYISEIFIILLLLFLMYMEIIALNINCPKCGQQLWKFKSIENMKKCKNCGYDLTKDYKKNDIQKKCYVIRKK